MIRRRFVAVLSSVAVVVGGFFLGASPATAAVTITNAQLTPLSWAPGSTAAAVVSWDESVAKSGYEATPYLSVEVEWDWSVSFSGLAGTTSANWVPADKAFECSAGSGLKIRFASQGFGQTGAPNCVITSSQNGAPTRVIKLIDKDSNDFFTFDPVAGSAISVTFESGVVTAASRPKTYQWTLTSLQGSNSYVDSNYALLRPVVPAEDAAGNPIPIVTIDIDGNGGTCNVSKLQDYQGTWTIAPKGPYSPSNPTEPGYGYCSSANGNGVLVSFNTSPDGKGLKIPLGGNVLFSGDNRIYAIYETPRPPGAPTAVTAVTGWRSVALSWTAPADTGSYPISNYLVQADPGGQVCITRPADASLTACSFKMLTPGVMYTFTAQALNGAGWGERSAPSNAVTPQDLRITGFSRKVNKLLFVTFDLTVKVKGDAPGFPAGTVLTPWVMYANDGQWVELKGAPAKVDGNERFTWERKFPKDKNKTAISVKFMVGSNESNSVAIGGGDGGASTPSAPQAVRALSVGRSNGFVELRWDSPKTSGLSPVIKYEAKSTDGTLKCTVDASARRCAWGERGGYDSTRSYTFVIRAQSESGWGDAATSNKSR